MAQLGESTCNARDLGSIPGLGRSPGEGNGYPLQYAGLENSTDCSPWDGKESDMTEWLHVTSPHQKQIRHRQKFRWPPSQAWSPGSRRPTLSVPPSGRQHLLGCEPVVRTWEKQRGQRWGWQKGRGQPLGVSPAPTGPCCGPRREAGGQFLWGLPERLARPGGCFRLHGPKASSPRCQPSLKPYCSLGAMVILLGCT